MTSPLFSIITAVRNGAATLQKTIDSVARQTCRDLEYIVMDGGSTDGTQDILRGAGESISSWASAPDHGIYDAFNRAVTSAKGTWIAFLGADDTYYPDALEQYRDFILKKNRPELEYISSRVELVRHNRIIRTIGAAWSWPVFSKYMTVAHVGSMHHISLFQKYGLFDISYKICGDYELLLRAGRQLRAEFLNRVTVKMAVGGVSDHSLALALKEQERAKRFTGGRRPLLCTLERASAHLRAKVRRLVWY